MLIPTSAQKPSVACAHCGNPAPAGRAGAPAFCCSGCAMVYELLTSNGLERYYELAKTAGGSGPAKAIEPKESYGYLDDPEFRKRYGRDDDCAMDFYLEGVENRSWLVRMGLAGACAGNIMLMSIPLYARVEGSLAAVFRWLSLVLFVPVIAYSAVPFYVSALTSIRTRTISIDLPIVLAIVFGTLASVAHLFSGSEHIYFDSLSALVFLLLASRYVLRRIQQNALRSSHLAQFLTPSYARRVDSASGRVDEVAVEALKAGDLVAVGPGEVVPVDGVVCRGSSSVNCALLTGESLPVEVATGSPVFSGTVNGGSGLVVEMLASGAGTKLGRILRQIQDGSANKAPIVTAADRLAKWFLLAVIAAA
ncbi:MAG: heavy metal translocating P-type ATPase metal-binding domain-containing protein, partial [Deltaproteobacteria bacterium]|nr:heavy metal translocating P-type ATPase metal-binding domain-containing protein [Deltaproteobacteria bacterium]